MNKLNPLYWYNRWRYPRYEDITLTKNEVSFSVCEHFGMWQLKTPTTHHFGLLVDGSLAGFSALYDHAVRECALQGDEESSETLRDLWKAIDYKDDHESSLLFPVYDANLLSKKL